MIKGAIFDVDGTLLDSMYIWDTIANDYLLTFGIEEKENLFERFRKYTQQQVADYYINHYGINLPPEKIISDVNSMIGDFYRYSAQLKPGMKDILSALKNKGVKMCVATAADKELVKAALSRCGVLEYFTDIFTCSEYGSKEEPEIYRSALKALGTDKSETYVFEDSLHAASTAFRESFPVISVFDKSENNPEKLKEISVMYLKDTQDIEKFLNSDIVK